MSNPWDDASDAEISEALKLELRLMELQAACHNTKNRTGNLAGVDRHKIFIREARSVLTELRAVRARLAELHQLDAEAIA